MNFEFLFLDRSLNLNMPSTQTKYKWFFIAGMLVCGIAVGLYFLKIERKKKDAALVRYPAFGIDMPDQYEIHGIDVSKYQEFIHWPSVKQMKVKNIKLGFAFIKATEGLSHKDEQFNRNWRKANEAGMACGAYHFFIAGKSGKAQADFFIRNVKLASGNLPPVLDIEQLYGNNPVAVRRELKLFLKAMEAHYKVKPIIYTYADFYSNYLNDGFDAYPLWIAHYFEPQGPRIDKEWLFWQHSDRGKVNGIKANVDFNVFNGDSADFKKLLLP